MDIFYLHGVIRYLSIFICILLGLILLEMIVKDIGFDCLYQAENEKREKLILQNIIYDDELYMLKSIKIYVLLCYVMLCHNTLSMNQILEILNPYLPYSRQHTSAWFLCNNQATKVQPSLGKCADSPEPLLLAYKNA